MLEEVQGDQRLSADLEGDLRTSEGPKLMAKKEAAARDWDNEDDLPPEDPEVVAERTRAAAKRLQQLAVEAREMYAVVGEGYRFSKTLKPMARRYAWREAAGLESVGKDEELRFAARWAAERKEIERAMTLPPLTWNPRSILSSYGRWKDRQGRRPKKALEIQDLTENLPRFYVLDEVEREHRDLGDAAVAAARKAARSANEGARDPRLEIAALQMALDRVIREYATDLNMSGAKINVDRQVELEQGARKRAYEHDGDF